MSSLEKKFWFMLITGLIAFGWHYIKPIIIPLRFNQLGQSCGIEEITKMKDSKNITSEQKRKISSNFWNCVQNQQSEIEKLFIEVPAVFLE